MLSWGQDAVLGTRCYLALPVTKLPYILNIDAGRAQMVHELVARLLVFSEATQHGRGDHPGMFLLDAAHHRTQVGSFDDDGHAVWIEDLFDQTGDLARHAFLNL